MSIEIQYLTPLDIPWGMELVESAGWNQLPDDWQRLLDYAPMGCFKALFDGTAAGTLTTTSYGNELAWIGMMLVHTDCRRRGIGKVLMQHAINYLKDAGIRTIKLDATPAGRPLYEQLGFRVEWEFQRWQADLPPRDRPKASSSLHQTLDPAALQLDKRAFGCDRTRWLEKLAAGSRVVSSVDGMGMSRAGRIANYLGPVVADDPQVAEGIVGELLSDIGETCFWDAPGPNQQAVALAGRMRFRPVRILYRMYLGEALATPCIDYQFAISDPATG